MKKLVTIIDLDKFLTNCINNKTYRVTLIKGQIRQCDNGGIYINIFNKKNQKIKKRRLIKKILKKLTK
jgi:hypothetical protein